tara:strand:- start:814 stop:999 length:186 start_codon:yes stop_codon:yes gene_type:complete
MKKLREEAGLSQVELADQSGISRQSIIHIESGQQKPKIDTIMRLSVPLNCSIDRLIKGLWE